MTDDLHLYETIREASRLRQQMLEDGTSAEDGAVFFRNAVRSAWPFTREWIYLCDHCRDLGWEYLFCQGDRTCGREKDHLPHDYVRPCTCKAGVAKVQGERTEYDEVAAAAKTPPRSLSRWGR